MRFFISIFIAAIALGALILTASESEGKSVVTVAELSEEVASRNNIRLGARVSDSEIHYQTEPSFELRFLVRDPGTEEAPSAPMIEVVYEGVMPDTLQSGRDVILEGDFDGKTFRAKSLLTQCPSKYEPPLPEDGGQATGDGQQYKHE